MNRRTWNIIITDKHSDDVPISNIINTRASCYNNFINYIICNLALKNYNIVEGDKDIVFNTVITDTSITEVYKFINNSNTLIINIKIVGNTNDTISNNSSMYADVIINIDNHYFNSFYECEDYLFECICNLNTIK